MQWAARIDHAILNSIEKPSSKAFHAFDDPLELAVFLCFWTRRRRAPGSIKPERTKKVECDCQAG